MSEKLNGNQRVVLHNRTKNIINLESFQDVDGKPIILCGS